MKPVISSLMAFSVSGSLLASQVRAALPPQYQNVKDLEVMVNYVKANPDVAATLKSIELENKTMNYGKDCQVTFERKPSTKPIRMVGPAAPLQYKDVNCPGE